MIVVYVLAADRTPLMPCIPVIARLLLKDGKAKVIRRTPFTIKLLARAEESYTQPLTLGVDTGSSVIGSAVADQNRHVLYLSEVEVRNDIAQRMKERAADWDRKDWRLPQVRRGPLLWSGLLHQRQDEHWLCDLDGPGWEQGGTQADP